MQFLRSAKSLGVKIVCEIVCEIVCKSIDFVGLRKNNIVFQIKIFYWLFLLCLGWMEKFGSDWGVSEVWLIYFNLFYACFMFVLEIMYFLCVGFEIVKCLECVYLYIEMYIYSYQKIFVVKNKTKTTSNKLNKRLCIEG